MSVDLEMTGRTAARGIAPDFRGWNRAAVLGVAALFAVSASPGRAELTQSEPKTIEEAPAEGKIVSPVVFDKDKPIEITSDQLDVDQAEKTAVFTGNVDAIQGKFHLTSDKLIVHYDGKEPATASAETTAAEPDAGSALDPTATGGRIRRMDVLGHVKMVSPTETATGDTAVYEVEKGTIDLFGDVVLTRGKNVIRGTKLTTNVDTGKSVIVGASSAGGGSTRVNSLFVPAKKDQKGADSTGDGKDATGTASQ